MFRGIPLLQLLLTISCLVLVSQSFSQDQYCFPFNKPFDMSRFKHMEHLIEVETPVYSAGDLSLAIQVVDKEAQNPVTSFRVTICEITGPKKVQPFPSKVVESEEGKVTLEALPESKFLLLVHADGFSTWHSWVTLPLETPELKVELEPSINITGRLLDRETNEPIDGMPVQIKGKIRYLHDEWEKGYITKSDSDGYFVFNDFPKDTYTLSSDWFPETVSEFEILQSREQRGGQSILDVSCGKQNIIYKEIPSHYPLENIQSALVSDLDQSFDEIKLDAVGDATITLLNKEGEPVRGFPVAMTWVNPEEPEKVEVRERLWTDENGVICLSMHCYRPGEVATVVTPDTRYRDRHIPLPVLSSMVEFNELYCHREKPKYLKTESDGGGSSGTRDRSLCELHYQKMSMPEHPCFISFLVQPGIDEEVTLVYQENNDDLPVTIKVIDKVSKEPISDYRVVISILADHFVQNLRWELLEEAKSCKFVSPLLHVKKKDGVWSIPDVCLNRQFRHLDKINLAISAEGYARESFNISMEEVRKGDLIQLKLENEASIKGRLVFGPNKVPLTVEAIEAALQKEVGSYNPVIKVTLKREAPRSFVDIAPSVKASSAMVTPGDDGVFEFNELPPADDWNLVVEAPSLPDYSQEIKLQQGVNDIGDIHSSIAGRITGRVQDTDGTPLVGTLIDFPFLDSYFTFQSITNNSGDLCIDLSKFPGSEHLVRITPPWGYTERWLPTIFFDQMITVSPFGENEKNFTLPKGNKLTVTIPMNEKYLELKELYSFSYTYRDEGGTDKIQNLDFDLTKASIVGINSGVEGPVYHQNVKLVQGNMSVNDQEIEIVFENVPPGEYAFYCEGILFDKEGGDEMRDVPLVYDELSMPSTDHEITTEINGVCCVFELKGAVELKRDTPLELIPAFPSVLIERVGPKSTGVHQISAGGYRAVKVELNDVIVPVYYHQLGFMNYKDGELACSPVVPVGNYLVTIQAIDRLRCEKWIVDQYEIEVKPGDGEKRFEIQCPLHPKKE